MKPVDLDVERIDVGVLRARKNVADRALVKEGRVIALVLRIDRDFPVAFQIDAITERERQPRERKAVEFVDDSAQVLAQRPARTRRQIDEDEILPDLGRNRRQSVVL